MSCCLFVSNKCQHGWTDRAQIFLALTRRQEWFIIFWKRTKKNPLTFLFIMQKKRRLQKQKLDIWKIPLNIIRVFPIYQITGCILYIFSSKKGYIKKILFPFIKLKAHVIVPIQREKKRAIFSEILWGMIILEAGYDVYKNKTAKNERTISLILSYVRLVMCPGAWWSITSKRRILYILI